MKLVALVRGISPSIMRCELTHLAREPIDLARARIEHGRYVEALAGAGCRIEGLPDLPDHPDAVFVEDTAVVLDELAVIARPGARSRRGETRSVASALRAYRAVARIAAPATLDGGDVLRTGRTLFVGITGRTNPAGARQLARLAEPLGYSVHPLAVTGCLHLKSAVTEVADRTLLINREWVDASAFSALALIDCDPGEPFAANALRLGNTVIHAAEFPATAGRLRSAGIDVRPVPAGELAKAEGGVTCGSLVFPELDRP